MTTEPTEPFIHQLHWFFWSTHPSLLCILSFSIYLSPNLHVCFRWSIYLSRIEYPPFLSSFALFHSSCPMFYSTPILSTLNSSSWNFSIHSTAFFSTPSKVSRFCQGQNKNRSLLKLDSCSYELTAMN